MNNLLKLSLVPSILLILFSCSHNKTAVVNGHSYEDVLNMHTESGKYYSDMETKLIANATYKELIFLNAQIEKQGRDLLYDDQKINMLKTKAKRDNEYYMNFFVSAYTPDDRFADFSRKKELWKFYLKKGSAEPVEAKKVKKISKSNLPDYEVIYTYISPWMQCYEVSFLKSEISGADGAKDISRPFTLIIAGKIGRLELLFD